MGAEMKACSQLSVSSGQPKIPVVQSSSAGGSYLSGRYCPHSMHFLCTPQKPGKQINNKSTCSNFYITKMHAITFSFAFLPNNIQLIFTKF